jgi:hypothetical protein
VTGAELTAAAYNYAAQATGIRNGLVQTQAALPVNATIGSATLVSGALALVGLGAKYQLAGNVSSTLRDADDLTAALNQLADEGAKLDAAAVSETQAARLYYYASAVQQLATTANGLAQQAATLGDAADLGAAPAGAVADASGQLVDAAGNVIDQVSWWTRNLTTIIVVLVLAVVALFIFSPAARGAVGKVVGR